MYIVRDICASVIDSIHKWSCSWNSVSWPAEYSWNVADWTHLPSWIPPDYWAGFLWPCLGLSHSSPLWLQSEQWGRAVMTSITRRKLDQTLGCLTLWHVETQWLRHPLPHSTSMFTISTCSSLSPTFISLITALATEAIQLEKRWYKIKRRCVINTLRHIDLIIPEGHRQKNILQTFKIKAWRFILEIKLFKVPTEPFRGFLLHILLNIWSDISWEFHRCQIISS